MKKREERFLRVRGQKKKSDVRMSPPSNNREASPMILQQLGYLTLIDLKTTTQIDKLMLKGSHGGPTLRQLQATDC